jgi:hypothetical protein
LKLSAKLNAPDLKIQDLDGKTGLILTQVMNNFNACYSVVILIKAFLMPGADLWKALLSDEVEIEF